MPLSWWSSIRRSCQMRMVSSTMALHTFRFWLFIFLISVFSLPLSLLPLSDDFPESTGVKRIVQALNANVWTSVEMKDGEMTSICLAFALSSDNLIYLCACMLSDCLYLCLIGHNQGFGLMSSLVASRHNNPRPHNCQDPPVSGNFV